MIAFYWIVSIALVFLNKILLERWDFAFPLSVTLFQLACTWFALAVLGTLGRLCDTSSQKNDNNCSTYSFHCFSVPLFAFVPAYEIRFDTVVRVLPLTVAFIAMLATGNLCLHYVEVSFYQVARSLTICFSIALSYLMLGVKTSPRAIVACFVVMVGFAIGAKGEPKLSIVGLVFGVVSSACVALYSILVKRSLALPAIDNNHWRLLAYNSTIAVPLMLPLALWQEWDGVQRSTAIHSTEFWIAMLAASALAVLISVATFMQINYTSALTNNISGTVKAAVQTVLAVLVFGNEITVLNAVGIAMVIGGSAWYSHLRYTEMQAQTQQSTVVSKKV